MAAPPAYEGPELKDVFAADGSLRDGLDSIVQALGGTHVAYPVASAHGSKSLNAHDRGCSPFRVKMKPSHAKTLEGENATATSMVRSAAANNKCHETYDSKSHET